MQDWVSAARRKASNDQTKAQTHSTYRALSTNLSSLLVSATTWLKAAKSRLKSKGHKKRTCSRG